ncbi:hypothetical protein [Nocardioides jensenii]|nr:hypothetical protein [Nocardioides jensenii]
MPITLGRGTSLWEGLDDDVADGFTIESLTTPHGLTHQFWNRRAQS